ncbi:MAG: YebC/PmpR family DNA-binding transcriptional regulator [Acidobacteria bacterium]|nr:MAG: YebC/PmpR family DNA-binding transcriptional regulator [Acidobacteriota bacterium]
MSGHSKWHTIKHKKSLLDARRGKIFTRLIREIMVAARVGGSGDPNMNPRLRKAIAEAKAQNMPSETIERAIKRGTGELEGEQYEEITYEGFGISGVAMLIETMTDNRNRTVAELRHLFAKHGGSLGEAGSVAWMFDKRGLIVIDKSAKSEDELLELVIEAGAEDMKVEEDVYEIYTSPENFEAVEEAVRKAGIVPQMAEVSMIPKTYIRLEGEDAKRMLKLYEAIEDHDDVQKVYANFEIDESKL